MSKSILLIDTPRNCEECPLLGRNCNGKYCSQGRYFRPDELTNDWNVIGKPDWCPLRDIKGVKENEIDADKVFKKIIAEFDKRINANTQLKIRAELGDKMCGYAYAKSIEAYKEGRAIVKQAAKEFNNDWILCSERLPEEPK